MRKTLILALCLMILSSCRSTNSGNDAYRQPKQLDDGLAIGTLADVNIDQDLIASAINDITAGENGEVHSLLIYKDGKLVLEQYFPGHDYQWDAPDFYGNYIEWNYYSEHNIHSAGKSVTSACVGIAVQHGFIDSVEQSIFDYLPDYQRYNTGDKDKITIEHLLTMTSGLEWDEWGSSYSDQDNDIIALYFDCDDPIACILEKPLLNKPGSTFNYSGGDMILLGEIIKNATGMDIEAFASQYLFAPLGIDTPDWQWINDTGVVLASGDQRLTSREMLKFGLLYLNDGVWNGQRILPETWVENSATPYTTWHNSFLKEIPPGDNTWGPRGYAYTWWTHEFRHVGETIPVYWAFGWGGQKIAVFPEQNAVVVFTGANYNSVDHTSTIIRQTIIPALVADN